MEGKLLPGKHTWLLGSMVAVSGAAQPLREELVPGLLVEHPHVLHGLQGSFTLHGRVVSIRSTVAGNTVERVITGLRTFHILKFNFIYL